MALNRNDDIQTDRNKKKKTNKCSAMPDIKMTQIKRFHLVLTVVGVAGLVWWGFQQGGPHAFIAPGSPAPLREGAPQIAKPHSSHLLQGKDREKTTAERRDIIARVAKAIHGPRLKHNRTNAEIWKSFWHNDKSGHLKSEPKELALYDNLPGDGV